MSLYACVPCKRCPPPHPRHECGSKDNCFRVKDRHFKTGTPLEPILSCDYGNGKCPVYISSTHTPQSDSISVGRFPPFGVWDGMGTAQSLGSHTKTVLNCWMFIAPFLLVTWLLTPHHPYHLRILEKKTHVWLNPWVKPPMIVTYFVLALRVGCLANFARKTSGDSVVGIFNQ